MVYSAYDLQVLAHMEMYVQEVEVILIASDYVLHSVSLVIMFCVVNHY